MSTPVPLPGIGDFPSLHHLPAAPSAGNAAGTCGQLAGTQRTPVGPGRRRPGSGRYQSVCARRRAETGSSDLGVGGGDAVRVVT